MICVEARELFSALVDEALPPSSRSSLEAHLATCGDCPRELERFRATLALLQGLPRPRAPVGFVDRVLARARPEPWLRRLGRRLFVPLRVKLPMEAAAVALVAVVAVYLVHRLPEPAEVARDGGSLQAPRSDTPTAPPRPVPSSPEVARGPAGPGAPETSVTSPPIAAPGPSVAPTPPASPAPGASGSPPPAVSQPSEAAGGPAASSSRARQATGDAAGDAVPPARPGTAGGGRSAAPPASGASNSVATAPPSTASPSTGATSTLELRAKAAPPVAARDATSEKERSGSTDSAARSADQMAKTAQASPSAAGTVGSAPGSAAPLARMLDRREMAPPVLSGRLAATVADPARELALLAARLGGRSSVRRLDALGGASQAVVDLEVPREALGELRAGLQRLGRWSPEGEPALATPPAPSLEPGPLVRVQVILVD